MDTVRTTITFPRDFHQELLQTAFYSKKSIGDIVLEKFRPQRKKNKLKTKKDEVSELVNFFKKMSKKGKQIDIDVKLIREMREERTNKLAGFM